MMRPFGTRVARLFVALVALTACGTPDDARTSRSTITDSAGVAIVTGPAADIPLKWTFAEAFRIGGADSGAGSFSDAHPRAVSTDAAGRIYVLDRKQHRVEVFEADGTPVRVQGRKGGGPGEVQEPFQIMVMPTGEVGVSDYEKRALIRWSPEGEVLPEYAFTESFTDGPVWLSGDTLVFIRGEYNERARTQALTVRTATDTFTTPTLSMATAGMVMFGCVGLNVPPMFTPELAWTGDARRQAVTHQVPYRIDVYEDGALARSVRRDIPPVTPDETHAARLHPDGGMKVQFGGGASCTVPISEMLEKQGIASQLPMIESLRYDPAGRLWAQRYGFREEPRSVDVFATDGDYLGTLAGKSLPLGFIGDDIVLFAEVDSDTDLPYVVAYRVTR